MQLSVLALISLGYKYLNLWPEKRELAEFFEDYQAIKMARFVIKFCPYIAVIALVAHLFLQTEYALVQGLTYSLLIASMIPQALIMLGVKADKYLPPSLANWYRESVARFNEQGGDIKLSIHKPRFIDLAELLNITYKQSFK